MSRLAERQRTETYITLHVAELQRLANQHTQLPKMCTDLIGVNDSDTTLQIVAAVYESNNALARGANRYMRTGTGLSDAMADALTRILDLAERTGVDLGAAVAQRLLGSPVDSRQPRP